MYKKYIYFLSFLFIITYATSCVNTKKATYFNDLQDGNVIPSLNDTISTIIQKNDILSIVITSLNPEASAIFNASNASITNFTSAGSNQSTSGYLVNTEGSIQLPILGNIKVVG